MKARLHSKAAICIAATIACLLNSPEARSAAQRSITSDPPPIPLFRAGTRLVEVEVVVRDKKGPVTGLTREDFTLLDQGRARPIAVFSAGILDGAGKPDAVPNRPVVSLSPGAVSNRQSPSGRSAVGATVVLLDLLNTNFDNQGYARKQILRYVQEAAGEQIAIYMLGKNLTVVQDFTDDSETLQNAIRKWSPAAGVLLMQNTENMDATDREMYGDNPVYRAIRAQITASSIATIVRHLSGIPGRKNLVWLSDTPGVSGTQLLGAANIHLYPVLARGVGSSGVVAWMRDTREMSVVGAMRPPPMVAGNEIAMKRANDAIAAANGGVGFTDSRDISTAVQTALDDAGNTYVLGFYPAEDALDNKYHALTVSVGKRGAARGRTLDVRYRPGYLATNRPSLAAARASIEDVFRNPLNATAIGITAVPGMVNDQYQVTAILDLHDVHFEMQDNRHVARLSVAFADDASDQLQTTTLSLSYADAEFAAALKDGLKIGKIFEQKAAVRLAVLDPSTGQAGSLRLVPATK